MRFLHNIHLLLFLSFPCFLCAQTTNEQLWMRGQGTAKVIHFKIDQPKQLSPHKEIRLERIKVDDSLSLLFDDLGSFLYLGEAGQLKNGRWFPSGEGLCREVISNPESGTPASIYSFCPWKRGSRHGTGLLQLPDGSLCIAIWKWNKLKKVMEEDPAPAQIERMKDYQARLEAMLHLMGD